MSTYFEHNAGQPELTLVDGDPTAELVPCDFCRGNGWRRVSSDPQDDVNCRACGGLGQLHPADLEHCRVEAQEAADALDPDARGDWEYHQRLER
jgi:hypothetical protein